MGKKMFEFGQKNRINPNAITSKEIFDKLPKTEQVILEEYKDWCLITASPTRSEEAVREVLRFREVTDKELDKIELDDLRYFLKELKESKFGDITKNKIKSFIQRFLRWKYKDWSIRFDGFDDIKLNGDAQRVKPITSKDVLSRDDIEKLLKAEKTLFWRTFLIVQYEGALRTGEVRSLKWDDIKFEDDDFCVLSIGSKKNKNGTIKNRDVVLRDSYDYLKQLKKLQKEYSVKSAYVFPSKEDVNKPVSKGCNLWFGKLTKEVLGKQLNNYLLRHSRGTELKKLVKKGKMSKDNATEFMGHSEKMFDKVYSHVDKEDVKNMLKKQIYDSDYIPPEKKHKLEKDLEKTRRDLDDLKKVLNGSIREIQIKQGIKPTEPFFKV